MAESGRPCDHVSMERRKRAAKIDATLGEACAVCGARDARLLVTVELRGGAAATLCGSHALMHGRRQQPCGSIAELRAELGERRLADRRAQGEGDELAERLTAAFTRDRRGPERRAG